MSHFQTLQDQFGTDMIQLGAAIGPRHFGDWRITATPDNHPAAVAYPRNTADVSALLAFCHARSIPVVPQGGLTGLTGGAIPVKGCLALSLERLRTIEEVDLDAATARVQAGVPLELVQQAAEDAGLLFPLDIGSRGSCQIGGNAATNAGGVRVLRYGMTRDLVLGIEAVLADGTVVSSLNKMLKNNTGYDLKQLFIGSEGTLGIITRLDLRLFPKPRSQSTALCAVRDYAGVLALLRAAKAGLLSSLSSFEVMWPTFYRFGTKGMKPMSSSKPWGPIPSGMKSISPSSAATGWNRG